MAPTTNCRGMDTHTRTEAVQRRNLTAGIGSSNAQLLCKHRVGVHRREVNERVVQETHAVDDVKLETVGAEDGITVVARHDAEVHCDDALSDSLLHGGAKGLVPREYFSDADAFRDPCLRLLFSLNLKQLYELLFLLLLATLMMGSSSSSNTAGSTVAQQQHSGTAATHSAADCRQQQRTGRPVTLTARARRTVADVAGKAAGSDGVEGERDGRARPGGAEWPLEVPCVGVPSVETAAGRYTFDHTTADTRMTSKQQQRQQEASANREQQHKHPSAGMPVRVELEGVHGAAP